MSIYFASSQPSADYSNGFVFVGFSCRHPSDTDGYLFVTTSRHLSDYVEWA
jgi:hypothetical protein